MRIPRRAAEERRLAMLNWFLAHPESTGEEAQRALTSGRMTGKKEIGMSLHTIHASQREAQNMLARGNVRPTTPAGEVIEGPRLQELRDLAEQLKAALQDAPNIESVIVDRNGIRMKVRLTQVVPL